MSIVRIIGDVHGKIGPYTHLIKDVEYSIQVGDLGFDAEYDLLTGKISPDVYFQRKSAINDMIRANDPITDVNDGYRMWSTDEELMDSHRKYTCNLALPINYAKHRMICGNHDNPSYGDFKGYVGSLGDYGETNLGGLDFFFLRGARSFDRSRRIQNVDWFEDEEMTTGQMNRAFEAYADSHAEVFISHCAPSDIVQYYTKNGARGDEKTTIDLQHFRDFKSPAIWFFGHYHRNNVVIDTNEKTIYLCLPELGYFDYDTEKSVQDNMAAYMRRNINAENPPNVVYIP